MAVMMGKLYAALRAGNVPEQQAVEAAEEIAGYEHELSKIKADLMLLKWMVGTNFAATLAVLFKLFIH
jgi:hypothetical protein